MASNDKDIESSGVVSNNKERIFNERSVYEQVWDACRIGLWTYVMVEIRTMAKQGKLEGNTADCILNMPLTITDLARVFKANESYIKTMYGPEQTRVLMEAMERYNERSTGADNKIVVIDDENHESECVYVLGVSESLKAVKLSFRGSVTIKDFQTDAKTSLRDVPNALYEVEPDQPEFIGIHYGFQEYLYATPEAETDNIVTPWRRRERRPAMNNKLQAILHQAATLLEENPGYSLVCTGHSLGGALAILCAFEAAASDDPRFPKPIACVSVANPRVGNRSFRAAVELLEKQGKLRLLRVANDGDIIPRMPLRSNFCHQPYARAEYHQVGPKLLLLPHWRGGYRLHRPRKVADRSQAKGLFYQCCRDVKRVLFAIFVVPFLCACCLQTGQHALASHNNLEYARRLEENKEELQNKYLADLYKEDGESSASSNGSSGTQ